MGIHYETATLRDIIDSHTRRELVLPNFKREFVWSVEDQRQLLTSLLADIPIGAVLLLRGKSTDFPARRFGRRAAAAPTAECTFLLDGQQRLACVHQFLSDPLREQPEWKSVTRDTYYNLRYRWLVRVVPDQQKPDPFGYFHLHFQGIREEPEALGDFVEPFRVKLAGSEGALAHPAWLDEQLAEENSNEGQLRYRIARDLADKGLVPLWEVISEPNNPRSLHGMVLQMGAMAMHRPPEWPGHFKGFRQTPTLNGNQHHNGSRELPASAQRQLQRLARGHQIDPRRRRGPGGARGSRAYRGSAPARRGRLALTP